MSDINSYLERINKNYEETSKESNDDVYWALTNNFQEFESALRSYIESTTKSEVIGITKKLKSGASLNDDEIDYLRLWVIGDAEYYIKMQGGNDQWIKDLRKIVEELNTLKDSELNLDSAIKLRSLLIEGMRLLGNIVHFEKQAERIKNFHKVTKELDQQERDILVRLLEGKLAGPKRQ